MDALSISSAHVLSDVGSVSDPLLIDCYAGDLNGKPDWPTLVAAGPPWHGAIIKATEGVAYAPPWFGWNWNGIKQAAGARLGVDFFRGCYHYLHFALGGAAQAQYYVNFVNAAGGWDGGDLWPIVDVESANNAGCTKASVVGTTSDFVAEVKRLTGREVILYGGSLMYDLGITDRMGCAKLWLPRYTATLPANVYQRFGWSLADLFAWQYDGDGESYVAGYPATSPIGKVDISAVIVGGGGDSAISWMRG